MQLQKTSYWRRLGDKEMSPIISKASPEEVSDIQKLVEKAYSPYLVRLGKPPGPMLDNYRDVIKNCEVYVAKTKGVLVGVLVLKKKCSAFLLDNLAVDPEKQGLGIGKALLEKAELRAIQNGFHEIILYTHEKMTENIPLYERIGYKETHRITESGYDRIYMSKPLTINGI